MWKMIWLLLLMPFAMSCATSEEVAKEAEHTLGVSVRITSTQPLSRPVVAIRNGTKSELRVWYHGNSWGWWNLSFCVVMDDGRVIHVKPGTNIGFTANAPVYEVIAPGSELTRNHADLNDGYWDIPKNLDLDKVRYICAVFFVEPSKESAEKGVWTGVVVSPWVAVPKR
jgi:hypothetical protein